MFHDDQPERAPRSLPWGSDQPAPPPPERDPAAEEPSGWRGRDVITGGALLLLGLVIFVATVIGLTVAGPAEEMMLPITLLLIGFQLWMGGIVLVMARRRGITLASLGLTTPNGRALWLMVPAWLGAYVAFAAYLGAVELAQGVTGADLRWLAEGNPVPADEDFTLAIWIALGVSVVLAAPIVEELFFRAFLFRALESVWPTPLAMTVSGFLFALVHQNLAVIIPFTFVGIILAWAYKSSGSLWTPIGAHLLVNGVAFTLTVIGFEA